MMAVREGSNAERTVEENCVQGGAGGPDKYDGLEWEGRCVNFSWVQFRGM